MARQPSHDEVIPLFVDDEELRQRINPKMGKDRFRSTLRSLERHFDFPRTNALFGGRYWPAVVAWLDNSLGLRKDDLGVIAQDGPENFDGPAQQ
jgi:hypothetical protein